MSFFFLVLSQVTTAQVSVGVNLQNTRNFITVGTNPDKEFFFDGRLGLGG